MLTGSIISRHDNLGSLCAFDPDHIFPRSRGGLSETEILMPVQWWAKKHVKGNKNNDVINAMTEEEVKAMQSKL